MTITVVGTNVADILSQLGVTASSGGTTSSTGGSTGSTTGSTGSGSTTPALTAQQQFDSYFPSNPALAPKSPEGAVVTVLSGQVVTSWNGIKKAASSGFLMDAAQKLWLVTSSGTSTSGTLTINGALVTSVDGSSNPYPCVDMTMGSDGRVYAQCLWGTGISPWQSNTGSSATTMYNATLPPPSTTTSPVTNPVVLPADPPQPAVQPGSSGKTLTVAPTGAQYTTLAAALAAAADGDTITVDPATPRESNRVDKRVHIIGTGVKWDFTGVASSTLAEQKGALVPNVDCIIDGFDIAGIGMDQTVANLTCAVRPDAPGWYTIKNCNFHGNQCGVGCGAFNAVIEIDNTTITNCGINDGQTHNIYIGQITRLVLNNVISTNPNGGYALKTRAYNTLVTGGTLASDPAACIDVPQGGNLTVSGTTWQKSAAAVDHKFLYACEESTANGAGVITVTGCTLDLNCTSPLVVVDAGSCSFGSTNTWSGNKPTATGSGTVTGLPA